MTIILLCSYYPYENGETFIENEIKFAENASDKIYIIPTYSQCIGRSRLNEAPNVWVNRQTIVESQIKRAIACIRTLFKHEYFREFISLKKCGKLNNETAKRALIFLADSNEKSQKIYKILKGKLSLKDNLVFYSYWLDTNAFIATNLKKKFSKSVVISRGHGFDIYKERNSFEYIPFHKKVLESIDFIFPISENGLEYLKTDYPTICDKLCVSRLGTNDYGIEKWELSDRIQIVSCSNVINVKRIDLIVDALYKLSDIKIKWVHFGDGPLLEKIKKLALDKIQNNIEYEFKGKVENSYLNQWYKDNQVDFFINVSQSEGIPVSIMEAMSFAIPCIATDVGGTSEIVENGLNGYLINSCEEDVPVKLATKLHEISTQTLEQRKNMRINARKTWELKYNADKNYLQFYQRIKKIAGEI